MEGPGQAEIALYLMHVCHVFYSLSQEMPCPPLVEADPFADAAGLKYEACLCRAVRSDDPVIFFLPDSFYDAEKTIRTSVSSVLVERNETVHRRMIL